MRHNAGYWQFFCTGSYEVKDFLSCLRKADKEKFHRFIVIVYNYRSG